MTNHLRAIRKSKKLTLQQAADLANSSLPQIQKLEAGQRKLTIDWVRRLAKAYGVTESEIMGLEAASVIKIPVVGFVGAGALVDLVDAYEHGGGMDELDCPPGLNPQKTVAVEVRGNSMEPFIGDGWYLYYEGRIFGVPPQYLGKLCVVKLADSDAVMVKRITAGDQIGHYHLLSYNEKDMPPLLNQTIEWSAKVAFIKPS